MGPLEAARQRASLSMQDLWLAYIGLGGSASLAQLNDFVAGGAAADSHDHDLVAQALNERFIDLGQGMPVPYFDEL